jgi:hypothetical protein
VTSTVPPAGKDQLFVLPGLGGRIAALLTAGSRGWCPGKWCSSRAGELWTSHRLVFVLDSADTLSGALATLVERFPQVDGLTVITADRRVRRSRWERTRARDIRGAGGARREIVRSLPTGAELVAAHFLVILAGLAGSGGDADQSAADRRPTRAASRCWERRRGGVVRDDEVAPSSALQVAAPSVERACSRPPKSARQAKPCRR